VALKREARSLLQGVKNIYNLRLRTHLTVAFITTALVPILVLGSIQVFQLYKITREYNEVQMQMTQRLANEIDAYVHQHKNAVEAVAMMITMSQNKDYRHLSIVLQSIQEKFPGFVNIYIADKEGVNIEFYPEGNVGSSLIGYNFSSRNYYQEIVARQFTMISSVFQGQVETTKPLIAIVVPIFTKDHQFDGYVSAALDLSKVGEFATKYDYGKNGYAVVIDSKGNAIYHPDEEIRTTIQNLSSETIVQRNQKKSHGAERCFSEITGEEEFSTSTIIDDLGWMVWVSKPITSYDEELFNSLQSTLTLLIVALLLTVALAWFLARWFNQTINLLVTYTKSLVQKDFDISSIQFKAHGIPYELQLLSQHFLYMAKKLKTNQQKLLDLNAQLEQRIEERTESLQAVLESMSDAVVMINVDNAVVYANKHMADLFDMGITDLLRAKEQDICKLASTTFTNCCDQLAGIFSGVESHCILTSKLEGVKSRHVSVSAFRVLSKNGSLLGRGYMWRDITQEYEIEQLKNNLISLASHEFKTPITSMKVSVETLQRIHENWDIEFQQELLSGMHEDLSRINELVDDWLDISKIDAGTLRIKQEKIPVQHFINKTLNRLRRQHYNHDTQVSISPKIPPMYADCNRLEQVVMNLISNAVRYNDRKPYIKITAWFDQKYHYIDIQDNGIGIAAVNLDHIFERFYCVDVSSTRRTGGTGLGLAICKGIVEAHHGKIKVSSAIGIGSTFTIILPRLDRKGDRNEKTADIYC
jgi:signal transduction histidine kinase